MDRTVVERFQLLKRSARLLQLIQCLRSHRHPVSGHLLAEELGVSLRTLYRDISTLQESGANIEGEAGIGYILKPGFLLPPLMFDESELEALLLGVSWVASRTNFELSESAKNAFTKIASVIPEDLKEKIESSLLLVGPGEVEPDANNWLPLLITSIRHEVKIKLFYQNAHEEKSERLVWPIALAFFDRVRILVAWCELRQDFRHFRTDRILDVIRLDSRYPEGRQRLLKKWRIQQQISHI